MSIQAEKMIVGNAAMENCQPHWKTEFFCNFFTEKFNIFAQQRFMKNHKRCIKTILKEEVYYVVSNKFLSCSALK
jgi:hypothetical protein